MREGVAIGVIALRRAEAQLFSERQVALLQTFADQAVIAIENARLLNELRQSLEQQTATADVLRVISSSPGNLEPVFQSMLENAVRICDAKFGTLFRFDGDRFRVAAGVGTPAELAEFERRRGPFRPELGSRLEHVSWARSKRSTLPMTPLKVCPARQPSSLARDLIVAVPMLKDDVLIGAIADLPPGSASLHRQADCTSDKLRCPSRHRHREHAAAERTTQIADQQTATSEVLRVISSSPGELKPVFQTMLENAVRICEAKFGSLFRFDGEHFHFAAEVGTPLEYADFERDRGPIKPRPGSQLERVMRTKQVCRVDDYAAEAAPAMQQRLVAHDLPLVRQWSKMMCWRAPLSSTAKKFVHSLTNRFRC